MTGLESPPSEALRLDLPAGALVRRLFLLEPQQQLQRRGPLRLGRCHCVTRCGTMFPRFVPCNPHAARVIHASRASVSTVHSRHRQRLPDTSPRTCVLLCCRKPRAGKDAGHLLLPFELLAQPPAPGDTISRTHCYYLLRTPTDPRATRPHLTSAAFIFSTTLALLWQLRNTVDQRLTVSIFLKSLVTKL